MMKQNMVPSFPPVGRGGSATALAIVAALLLGTSSRAQTDASTSEGLTVTDTWFRSIMPGRPAGGYFTLRNDSGTPRKLVGAASPACGMASLHETSEGGGVAKMVAVEEVDVPAHGSVIFAPGGRHIMCMEPTDAMKPGNTVPLTLKFADRKELTTDFMVKSVAGE